MIRLQRDKYFKLLMISLCGIMAAVLTGCDSADIPDQYNYEGLTKYIKLCDYKGIEYEAINTEVTSSEVRAYIDEQLQHNAKTKQLKSGTVESDSVVVIDYQGRLDGKLVDGASAESQVVDMSNNNYVDGFAEGLLGHKVGDTFDMNVTFPQDYAPELAGKTVVFKITINSLQTSVVPEYTDEYVKENTEYSSKQAYEKAIKEELETERKPDAKSTERIEVFNQIVDGSEVLEYPKKEYEERYNAIIDSYKQVANDNDKEFSEYLKSEMNMTEDEFNAQAKLSAESAVKQELVLYQIAKKEGIEITKKEYNDYLDKCLKDAGYTKSQYKEKNGITIEEYAEKNNLFSSLLYDKVMDKVMTYSLSK